MTTIDMTSHAQRDIRIHQWVLWQEWVCVSVYCMCMSQLFKCRTRNLGACAWFVKLPSMDCKNKGMPPLTSQWSWRVFFPDFSDDSTNKGKMFCITVSQAIGIKYQELWERNSQQLKLEGLHRCRWGLLYRLMIPDFQVWLQKQRSPHIDKKISISVHLNLLFSLGGTV